MEYDFSKPPERASIARYGKNKKAHLYFHQGNAAFAVALFQNDEFKEYFEKHISFKFQD